MRIQQILKHEDKWLAQYTLRENNQIADFLVKMAFVNKEELRPFDNPSLEIQEIIKNHRSRGMLTPNIHIGMSYYELMQPVLNRGHFHSVSSPQYS
ncbi:hypothetical protein J1N35_041902 [Gossypium stocksii]|uniref:RNase H type-1 domain-containing protein n=1 Tax=Gossypium stocksii TaxID=47602 RepID=A0A9D3UGD0_9ROSI|nr:hypothetical protein J1N35_041902 [Gossypium stocksii]